MLSDEEFGQALGTRLRTELADIEPLPRLATAVRRRHARHTRAVRLATSVVAALAVALTAGLVRAGSPDLHDVAYVEAQMLGALNHARNYIVRRTQTDRGSRVEELTDRATGQYRSDTWTSKGAHVVAETDSAPKNGMQTTMIVYYLDRLWVSYTVSDKSPPPGITEPHVDLYDPMAIRQAIEGGTLRLVGEERVDGHETVHVRLIHRPGDPLADDIWVDAKTFLLYGAGVGPANAPTTPAISRRWEWLPRTPENLALFSLTPPRGFRQYK